MLTSLHQLFSNYLWEISNTASVFGEQNINHLQDWSQPRTFLGDRSVIVDSLPSYIGKAVKHPLSHLASLEHMEESSTIALFEKAGQAECQCPHTKSPTPWDLTSPEREFWHVAPNTSASSSSQEEEIPQAGTVVYFLTAAGRHRQALDG